MNIVEIKHISRGCVYNVLITMCMGEGGALVKYTKEDVCRYLGHLNEGWINNICIYTLNITCPCPCSSTTSTHSFYRNSFFLPTFLSSLFFLSLIALNYPNTSLTSSLSLQLVILHIYKNSIFPQDSQVTTPHLLCNFIIDSSHNLSSFTYLTILILCEFLQSIIT